MMTSRDASTAPRPSLTIAVLDYRLRGYPCDCLDALDANQPDADREFLLVSERGNVAAEAAGRRFPRVRQISLDAGDRASAKNAAVRAARGSHILLVSADTVPQPGASDAMLRRLERDPGPLLLSAQFLLENGMRCRTRFAFPSIIRSLNPFASLRRWRQRIWYRGRPPDPTGEARVDAFHSWFLMASRETFNRVGPFREGYRFGYDDLEWCWRARRQGVPRVILRDARVFRVTPELYGLLSPDVRAAMQRSAWRMVADARSPGRAAAYRAVTRAASLLKWVTAASLAMLVCRASVFLNNEAAAHRMIALSGAGDPDADAALRPDEESRVRWEGML